MSTGEGSVQRNCSDALTSQAHALGSTGVKGGAPPISKSAQGF